MRKLLVASSCGFCAGVRRALALIDKTLDESDEPPHVLRGVIHNRFVTARLKARGVCFVETPQAIPPGKCCIFGAHGVAAAVERAAAERGLRIVDATCPLVKKLHRAAAALKPEEELILFGHRGHPEVEGIIGHSGTSRIFVIDSPEEAEKLPELRAPTLLVQTTLNCAGAAEVRELLRRRFPNLKGSGEICDASFRRQHAVAELAEKTPLVLIIGSAHSSNANRLRETAAAHGAESFLIDTVTEIPFDRVAAASSVGVGAGASTPDELIEEVLKELERRGFSRA